MECLTVVAFDPSCPQTKRAVERRRVLGLWEEAPVLWLARERTPGVTKFEKSLPKGDRLLADEDSFHSLHVDAIPAAFMVGSDSTLARVWPFTGRESVRSSHGTRGFRDIPTHPSLGDGKCRYG
jgi:hypothetical protein